MWGCVESEKTSENGEEDEKLINKDENEKVKNKIE